MTNEKNLDLEESLESQEEEFAPDNSNRARNRTVMLTPEITGQVRRMLAEEVPSPSSAAPRGDLPQQEPRHPVSSYSPAGGVPHRPQEQPAQRAAPTYAQAPQPTQVRRTPVVGFLVSFDRDPNGEVFELRSGRWIVSSEQTTSGNFIIVQDETISPLHAIIRVAPSGEIQVLDQLSEHGTGILKIGAEEEETLTGSMSSVDHGDLIRFGDRSFHVCVIQRGE